MAYNNQQNPATVSVSISNESMNNGVQVQNENKVIDEMFPLFTAVFQQANIPIIFVYPFLVFFFLQVVIVTNWPWQPYWEINDTKGTMKLLRSIFFYIPQPPQPGYYFVIAFVIFAINVIIFILIRFQLAYFKVQRNFINVLNYPIRFYFDTILIVILIPSIIGVGETFLLMCHGYTSYKVIVSMLLYLINVAYEVFSFAIVQGFASKSVNVNVSPLLNFDPSIMIITLAAIMISLGLYFILALFEDWARLVAIALHFAMYVYIVIYILRRIPFVDIMSQSLSCGWQFSNMLGDVIMIISYFVKKFNYNIPLGLTFGCFIGLTPAFLIYHIFRVKKIISQLQETFSNEEEASEYYTSLGLDKNEIKALLYLRIGFQNYCLCFYNWSLVNFIINKFNGELALSTCLQLVNYFPKETRLLNRIERLILTHRKIGFTTRFLIYQVDSIKTLRQFSVSSQSKLKLIELKNMSKQCEMLTRGAVDSNKLTPNYFENLANKAHMIRAVWRESLENAPNNPKFCEEFSRYLIECECDFPEGLKIRHRAQVIEMGLSFSIDYSFRSMVRAFPGYITKKILDLKGAVNDKKKESILASSQGSQSSTDQSKTSGSQNSSTMSENFLDLDVEEMVGKQTIYQSRTRLALHRALENKLPNSIKSIIPATIFIIVCVIAIFAFTFIYSERQLATQTGSLQRLDSISQITFYSSIANADLILEFIREHNVLDTYMPAMRGLMRSTDPVFINVDADMLRETMIFTTNSSIQFGNLINSVAQLALEGEDIYDFAKSLIKPVTEIVICDADAKPAAIANESFSSLVGMMISHQRELSGNKTVKYLLSNPNYCELYFNFNAFYEQSIVLFDSFCDFQRSEGNHLKRVFGILEFLIPCETFVSVFIPVIVIHILTIKSLKDVIEIIKGFDVKAKNDAKALITIHATDDDTKIVEMTGTSRVSYILITIILFISLGFLLCSLIICILVVNSNTNIINLNSWNQFASLRLSSSASSLYALIYSLAMHDLPEQNRMTSISELVNLSLFLTKELADLDNKLVNGFEDTPACKGFDEELDQYNIIDKPAKPKIGDPHDFYAQTSIHQQIDVYRGFVQQLANDLLNQNQNVSTFIMANSIHIVNAHMWMRLMNVTKRMIKLADMEYNDILQNIIIIGVCVTILLISFVVVVSFYYTNRASAYKAVCFVSKRFNPATLVNNKLFSKTFLKSKSDIKDDRLSVDGLIILNATDSIFLTSVFGVVEIVNKSVQGLIGYTPEQILGQHISQFFTSADEDKITNKLEMMRSGQISTFAEEDFTAVTDNNVEIPCHVTIVGIKNHNNDDLNSFAIIVRDQTALVHQMKQAEEAKAKSEKLLYQILPRDIVVQLNRGEKDITFTVNSATIIFIDIVRFSEYTVNLSPQDIMQNLSLYFAGIDKIASKYNMVTKIKLIGDIYMAAAGLFNPETSPESHAEQAVMLGLDSIAELDEINMRLDSSLTIRVGVNSGGPIIAGVLGTDKPAFDIIGDPINVAARLQSTDEANHVHISQATYDLIKGMSFDIAARVETFLKGKGKQMTYLVNPVQSYLTSTGSFHRQ
ncbi:Adenylate and Guanylate cyclase catalytic domain containing protein [Trichomonas vaginalis G3]|uniref:Adenylate and Guanylate cyclase catalytic domain containing protein n=1 Tax=Trichomonas vaginalis (strain ATCC PRA-98 / G3) TaxID=412133 RepID=A2FID0_TRIV3|nr:guanylate cyclase protein [Trichomonas vaginalis G3]EAX95332.1 Adenylate and Guanylate cyclase catalytic domain containing protein [Trichomonas vaginalis G3]KAI5550558.1 guanylate cyclase protein [Trichomonas vaginalis G3]|eukprot:XP_001308262.1 Adenylate and Guanylate cyclase catalytic domain containing protein [Trichomonas vaginalis G3]